MKITRRNAIGLLATAASAAVEQEASAQPPTAARSGETEVHWIDGEPPALGTGVSWGVPWPRGSVHKDAVYGLATSDGRKLPLEQWPLAYWPDGSIKWMGFATVTAANDAGPFQLKPTAERNETKPIERSWG